MSAMDQLFVITYFGAGLLAAVFVLPTGGKRLLGRVFSVVYLSKLATLFLATSSTAVAVVGQPALGIAMSVIAVQMAYGSSETDNWINVPYRFTVFGACVLTQAGAVLVLWFADLLWALLQAGVGLFFVAMAVRILFPAEKAVQHFVPAKNRVRAAVVEDDDVLEGDAHVRNPLGASDAEKMYHF